MTDLELSVRFAVVASGCYAGSEVAAAVTTLFLLLFLLVFVKPGLRPVQESS